MIFTQVITLRDRVNTALAVVDQRPKLTVFGQGADHGQVGHVKAFQILFFPIQIRLNLFTT